MTTAVCNFDALNVRYRCMNCKHETKEAHKDCFRCPKCGHLFDVKRDLPKRSAEEWSQTFDDRLTGPDELFRSSGVFRFFEGVTMTPQRHLVSAGEGNIPMVRASSRLLDWLELEIKLYFMLQGKNPDGAFKGMGMCNLVSRAVYDGQLVLICASTGDTSAALALYAARAGLKCIVFLPEGQVTPAQLVQLQMHGATVILVPGSFDDCQKIVRELVAKHGYYPANSIHPARIEGHKATVFLSAQFLRWKLPDVYVVPVGNGSDSTSIHQGLCTMADMGFDTSHVRILGCQSAAAAPLARSFEQAGGDYSKWLECYQPLEVSETAATAMRIGDPASYLKVIRGISATHGSMEYANERELYEAWEVLGSDGLEVCTQTAVAFAGLKKACRKGFIKRGQTVVLVSTADGLKFSEAATQLPVNQTVLKSKSIEEVLEVLKAA